MTGKEKRELKALIIELRTWDILECWQKQPYTAVRMVLDGTDGFGFSKVSHPDDWDEVFGKDLATKKAAAHIVKQIGDGDEAVRILQRMQAEKKLRDSCC